MNEIVVGYDGSPGSELALQWAANEAERRGTPLRLLSTWELPLSPGPFYFQVEKDLRNAARQLQEKARARVSHSHQRLDIRTTVTIGPAAPALLDASHQAALLVVGSRGHGTAVGLLLGSVSLHCATHASCPVVVVPAEAGPRRSSPSPPSPP
jgi:nucleotide-binding universal stress UspA family protein